ncbi:NADH-quinone oxidoreductase subunit NuoE [Natranaerofaba carboxydovora]|uniref:NADH-quinone oxidoreductase subunit NuoE n=1 Tax=Natranaerofaba carboxydovora TaxID=2742683 RepID=UPI001F142149|nr:NADH-quinone oxidoreductase subunit NuoE [Natranaerofaba carboxydovora]UMZ72719.1 NADP-reducing hydrogenase subunit HndA [Natranaerofaba carboxydovora]
MKKTNTAKRIDTKVQANNLEENKIRKLIDEYKEDQGGLIPLLQKIQEEEGYLSRDRLEMIANEMNLSLAKVMGVVTFYSQFHLTPKGENVIRVCMGTACHVKGAGQIMEKLQNKLEIETGETTPDGKFTIDAVSCIGACGLAPVATINHDTHGKLTTDKVNDLLDEYDKGSDNK